MAHCLTIGSDKGIGRAISQQLSARGDVVTAVCLEDGAAYAGSAVEVIAGVDVTSDDAVRRMAAAFAANSCRFDMVIHIAGVLGLDALGAIDYADMRRQFEINTLGPLRTIEAVRDFLAPAAKVGVITSRVGSLNDNGSGGMYAYRVSKAGANMVVMNLHHDLSNRGIAVAALHPGMVATDLTKDIPGDFTYITPDEAAAGLITRMDELTLQTSGHFWHANGEQLPW